MSLKGEIIEVTGGRKYPNGTLGVVFWNDMQFDRYQEKEVDKLGFLVLNGTATLRRGDKGFCKASQVRVVTPTSELVESASLLLEESKRAFKASRPNRSRTAAASAVPARTVTATLRPIGPPVPAFTEPTPEPTKPTGDELIALFAETMKELA